MPRKSSPFEPVEWPEVVEQGFAFATKAAGFPFGMLILGFPGETEDDINETIALFDRLRNYRSILIPFAFEATGMLDQENSFRIRNTKRLHLELVKKIFSHNVFWGKRLIKEQANNLSIPNWLLPLISPLIDLGVERACRKLLNEVVASASPTQNLTHVLEELK